ncbi:hypothetical protein HMI56_007568 [Coelomomyces lativittatus]|nr:hypothetical protein HMI56_007568 [Coelomomyces lativittatus]
MDKFGFYEKTTANPPNAERVFNVREKRKADPVPDVKKEPKVTVEEEYKNNNVQDKEKHDLKVPMHPTIPEPTSPVINKDTETVTLANIKNTKNKNEKIGSRGPLKKDEPNTFTQTNVDSTKKREEKPKIPVPPKTRPPLPNIKSPEQLSREAILKERKRVAKAMWGSGRKIDFEKLGLGLNELNPSTSREQTRGDSINLKKRQVSYEKYYDITLTLGYIEEIKNPRHAEQYLADVMNLLQCYYERFNFKGYSARLSGSHYLLHHDTLVKFQGLPKIPENKVGYYFGKWLNYKKPFQTADQNFLLSLKPKSLQSTFTSNGHTTINTGCWKMSASGVAFIREDSITNAYELITTLAHEIAHGTGMDHANTPGCFGNGQTMLEPNRPYFKLWMPFAQCTLNQMVCTPSSYR